MSERVPVDRAEVERIARLARLTFTEAEAEALTGELGAILGYVEKLRELDTSAVEPTSHAVELATRLRDDEPRPGLPVEIALRGAPERLADGFGVPKILD